MYPTSPVLPGHAEMPEVSYGKPGCNDLPAVIIPGPEGEVISRWKMSDDEIALLVNGGDVYLSLMTFGEPLQPILLRVATPEMIMKESREIIVDKERLQEIVLGDDVPPA